jgi:hypothetical protein
MLAVLEKLLLIDGTSGFNGTKDYLDLLMFGLPD